jgi:transcriptional regulator with XRE-family HTH domain
MAKDFKQLQAKMSPKARRRSEARANRMIREMALGELRVARQLTQEQLAAQLKVRQPAIAKLERRADMYLSTLRNVIEGMGGELDVRAVFPDGSVRIKKFKEIKKRA